MNTKMEIACQGVLATKPILRWLALKAKILEVLECLQNYMGLQGKNNCSWLQGMHSSNLSLIHIIMVFSLLFKPP